MLNIVKSRRNKMFKFFIIVFLLSILFGIIIYFKNKSTFINLDVVGTLRSNNLYHILFTAITYFSTIIIVGPILGIMFFSLEVASTVVITLSILSNLSITRVLEALCVILFKGIYLVLFIYLLTRSIKSVKYMLLKKEYVTGKLNVYLKEAIISSLIIIIFEITNYLFSYKLINLILK